LFEKILAIPISPSPHPNRVVAVRACVRIDLGFAYHVCFLSPKIRLTIVPKPLSTILIFKGNNLTVGNTIFGLM